MKIIPNVFCMQLGVPHSEFGKCEYFMPEVIREWLLAHIGPFDYNYSGGSAWGDGYTNGITNRESTYMIKWVKGEDGLAVKLRFPKVKVHMCPQYD